MTPYALLLQVCGLSQREAADLHGVRLDTVKSWVAGRRSANAGVIAQLGRLHSEISCAAEEALDVLMQVPAGAEIEIGYPADDHEAQALGLPSVGAWRAMAGQLIAALDRPVILVPRGSTPATAAAADAHGL